MLVESLDWGCFNCLALVSLHKALLQRWRGAGVHAALQTGTFQGHSCERLLRAEMWKPIVLCFTTAKGTQAIPTPQHQSCAWPKLEIVYAILSTLFFQDVVYKNVPFRDSALKCNAFPMRENGVANKHDCSFWQMEFHRSRLPCDLVSSVGLLSRAC